MARGEKGFTLLEVLVALTVAGVALAALMKIIGVYVSDSADIQQRIYAHWAASNVLMEGMFATPWPGMGTDTGSTTLAGHEWSWQRTVTETPYDVMRKVEIRVFGGRDGEQPIARVIGYAGEEVSW